MDSPSTFRKYTEGFFDLVDVDGDGTISILEFVKMINTKRKQFLAHHSTNVLDYFRKIDVDNSGEIDCEELMEHLQNTGDYEMFKIIVQIVDHRTEKRSSFTHMHWIEKAKRQSSPFHRQTILCSKFLRHRRRLLRLNHMLRRVKYMCHAAAAAAAAAADRHWDDRHYLLLTKAVAHKR